MTLEKLSQLATNLREHIAFVGLPIANILFLIILIIAKFIGDWRREVDVLGQLALDIKRLAEVFPFWQKLFLNLSLNWMTTCLDICIKNEADVSTLLTYRLERGNCIIDLLEHKLEIPGIKNPFDFGFGDLSDVCALAEIYYPSLVCRAKTKLAKLLFVGGQTVKAITEAEEAFADGEKHGAHPSHITEALIVRALAEGKLFDDPDYTVTKLKEALDFARQHNLVLRIKEIEKLIKETSEK